VPVTTIREFLRMEAAGGIVLAAAAVVGLIWANSPFRELYTGFLDLPLSIQVGALKISKPLLLAINDGLMAIFFLIVGLEIKREVLEGELSSVQRATLPAVAAIGGMIVPAVLYLAFNWGDPATRKGWAIPAATDIAFAVAVLALVGRRAPASLRVFLLALAILDDLGAIIIIALFYTTNLSTLALGLAGAGVAALAILNRMSVTRLAPYVLIGILLWVFVLKSGVHATLAGVALAFAIPLRASDEHGQSPLRHLEHVLHPWVAYAILPLFSFANAGVSWEGLSPGILVEPVPLGIVVGLFLGKQIGVMGATWGAARLGIGTLPGDATWLQFYGMAMLTGIGFTMSLFIGGLAFDEAGYSAALRVGVLTGSMLSGFAGFLLLYFVGAGRARQAGPAEA
jgi:Na+:H+ antiporter, NhaA family